MTAKPTGQQPPCLHPRTRRPLHRRHAAAPAVRRLHTLHTIHHHHHHHIHIHRTTAISSASPDQETLAWATCCRSPRCQKTSHLAHTSPPPPLCPQNNSHLVFIPGPGDPCAGDVLPQPPLPKFFTEQLRTVLPKASFASNPCRCGMFLRMVVLPIFC